jgi:hypothetical protein
MELLILGLESEPTGKLTGRKGAFEKGDLVAAVSFCFVKGGVCVL